MRYLTVIFILLFSTGCAKWYHKNGYNGMTKNIQYMDRKENQKIHPFFRGVNEAISDWVKRDKEKKRKVCVKVGDHWQCQR